MSSPESTPGANRQIEIDTFGDLIEDGWTVRMREDDDDKRDALLVPPGFADKEKGVLTVDFLSTIPAIHVYTDPEANGPMVTAKAAVQTRLRYERQRHPAYEPADRRAGILTQRAFKAIEAERFKFSWISDGGGLSGSDNYAAYQAQEAKLIEQLKSDTKAGEIKWLSDEWHARLTRVGSEAVRATWTYQKFAEPLGLTKISGVAPEMISSEYGSVLQLTGYLEPSEKEQ